jgi:lantibiotic leader peptide-processing serine protease
MRCFFLRKPLIFAAFTVAVIITAVFVFRPAPAGAQSFQTYVLTANTWGPAQDAAVAAAGGSVTFSHRKTGIGVATSASPDFLNLAMGTGAFKTGAKDMMVQWQPPVRQGELIEAAVTPEDETFINLQWNYRAVEADGAWAAGYTGQGVRVAVIDGGIYDTHIDLVGQVDIAASRSFVPGYPFNFDYDVNNFWHGTHVAGIIAAKDNGIGTIGIAPGATIIGVKALHDGSGTFGAVISGILYASTPLAEGGAGADIINMSLRGIVQRAGGAGYLVAALNKAVNYAGKKTLVVSAAGNDYANLDHIGSYIIVPAMSGSGIAVSATGPMGYAVGYPAGATNFRRIASYTNYGNSVIWLAAPGGDWMLPGSDLCTMPLVPLGSLTRPCWYFDMVMSSVRGPDDSGLWYNWASGTSMAAPAVSAVAALVKERFPWFTPGDIKSWLAATADDEGKVGNDPYYGKGFVNAYRAVTE